MKWVCTAYAGWDLNNWKHNKYKSKFKIMPDLTYRSFLLPYNNRSFLHRNTYTICIPVCAFVVTVAHCYSRGPVQNHRNPAGPQPTGLRNNTVCLLACGYVASATRAPQKPSRHNRRPDCSPSGSNYPYISKECWPLCEPRFILLRVLQPAQWARPPTSSTQTCRRTDRGSPFTREVVQKHPVSLSYVLFYTKLRVL